MPRLSPALLRRAHRVSPHVRTLLSACRDIESAQHELRWIREHVSSSTPSTLSSSSSPASPSISKHHYGHQLSTASKHEAEVARLCARRGRGEPLQYVLGTQPFGPLEIRCAPGVLVPRPETEAYTVYLASFLAQHHARSQRNTNGESVNGSHNHDTLGMLDLCTGTGCIVLLLYERLRRHSKRLPPVRVAGVDISPTAVTLARRNLANNVQAGLLKEPDAMKDVLFAEADIFADDFLARSCQNLGFRVDVMVSNPPYISTQGFSRDTGRSVRNFEPRLALVPDERLRATAVSLGCELEDVFYARLLIIARELKPKFMLFEVGDLEQAKRVVNMASRLGNSKDFGYEIWRDEPDAEGCEVFKMESGSDIATVRGEGHGSNADTCNIRVRLLSTQVGEV